MIPTLLDTHHKCNPVGNNKSQILLESDSCFPDGIWSEYVFHNSDDKWDKPTN